MDIRNLQKHYIENNLLCLLCSTADSPKNRASHCQQEVSQCTAGNIFTPSCTLFKPEVVDRLVFILLIILVVDNKLVNQLSFAGRENQYCIIIDSVDEIIHWNSSGFGVQFVVPKKFSPANESCTPDFPWGLQDEFPLLLQSP